MSEIFLTCTPSSGGKARRLVWKSIRLRKSLDEICHSLEAVLPYAERANINKHDTVQVRYKNPYITDNDGERPVSTLYVDTVDDSTDTQEKSITVIARSPARDIIDSQWSDRISGSPDLLTVVQTISKRFGIQAMHMPTNQNGTKAVYSFSWENESPWAKLLTEADAQGYILTSNQIGNLYLWKPATGVRKEGFMLTEGVNVKSVRNSDNGSEQFHEYVVKCCGKEGTAVDSTCRNKRILTINLSEFIMDQEKLNRRARTEMLRRREKKITCTVAGWGLTDRQIRNLGSTFQKEVFWETNFLIPVKLPSSGIDANMLVSQVEYSADASSVSCDITLVNPEAYR